jgi:hypothetical protein
MSVPVLLFAASLFAPPQDVPAPPSPPPALSARFDVDGQRQQQQPIESRQLPTGDRPHTVGFGGQVAISNHGAGAGTRLFFGKRLGVDLNAFWYTGGSRYTTTGPGQGSTYGAFPSVIYMLSLPDKTRDVDIRPYVGGGVSYVSMSQPTTNGRTTVYERVGGTGEQMFGGVEMTFSQAQFMTISAEGIYYRLPVNYVNTSVMDGFNYMLAFHFYLK